MQCKTNDSSGDQCNETVRMVRAIPEVSRKIRLRNGGGFVHLFDVVPAEDGLCYYCKKKKDGRFT